MIKEIVYFIFLLVIILSAVLTIYASIIGAPIFLTSKSQLKKILREAGLKKGDRIYDLGSGTGRVLIIAEKYFNATSVGFELSPFLYAFSKVNLFFNETKNSKVVFHDFYNQNLADADMVFIFLMPYALGRLRPKFERELRKGTKVISYVFEMKGWQPKRIFKEEGFPASFIYEI